MKKIFALALAAFSTVSMFAAIDSQLTIYLDSESKEVEARIAAGDTYSPFDAGASASYVPMYSNPSNIGLYVQYEGGDFMELNAPVLVNVPLVIVTSREAAANQNYELFAEVGASHTTPVYVTDLRPDGGGDPYTFELNDLTDYSFTLKDEAAYIEGQNCVIADRFVINYNYVNLKGDFDNPNGGGAWIWINDFVEHGETATKEYTLPADAWCHFQVVENGVDYADSFDFDESNKSHQFTTPGWSEELTLHTAEAGVYTFTWNYVTNTLTIDFPAAPVPTCTEVRSGLNVDQYYTICLPKAVAAANGASFWSMSNRGDGIAYLVEAELPLVAGRPYIFQAEATELCVEYSGDAVAAGSYGALVGTFDAMDQAALDAAATDAGSDIYLLNSNELRKVNGQSDNHLAENRAYIVYDLLDYSVPNQAPGRRVRAIPMQPQTATGVENLNAVEAPVKTVIDGKMYILRGEHMFDATGRMVK